MIPLKDRNPRYSTPFITILLIAANTLVFFYQLKLGQHAGDRLIFAYGMIPARIEWAFTRPDVTLGAAFLPFLSSMFLHGSFWHLLGNMWFLWVFGDNVEDRLGHLRYLLFYLICGIGAGVVHVAFNVNSTIPAVGASGAISGIMGAYIVTFPRSRVLTLIPLFIFFFTVELPAVVLLGYWFLIQTLSGLASLGQKNVGGVAFWAHIGGFLLGMILVKVFPRARREAYFPD